MSSRQHYDRDGYFETAMLYVSDHGESLGEGGVYLHGLPFVMAPAARSQCEFQD